MSFARTAHVGVRSRLGFQSGVRKCRVLEGGARTRYVRCKQSGSRTTPDRPANFLKTPVATLHPRDFSRDFPLDTSETASKSTDFERVSSKLRGSFLFKDAETPRDLVILNEQLTQWVRHLSSFIPQIPAPTPRRPHAPRRCATRTFVSRIRARVGSIPARANSNENPFFLRSPDDASPSRVLSLTFDAPSLPILLLQPVRSKLPASLPVARRPASSSPPRRRASPPRPPVA